MGNKGTAYLFFQLWLIVINFGLIASDLQCLDDNNEPVDWFVIYKLPKQRHHSNSHIEKGVGFVYVTSKNYTNWIVSPLGIDDERSMVAGTLEGLFNKTENNLYILYNDQPPYGTKSETKGHTKGAVLANENGGLWLIHSVPNFPYSLQEYVYPTTGLHYGQSFMCISMDLKNLDLVGVQLQYNEPHIYAQNTPSNLQVPLPEIVKAAQNVTVKDAPWYNIENISSRSDAKFISFAKSGKFKKDLYADLVSVQLGTDLYVETWPNEPNRLPSNCDHKNQVDNILSVEIPEVNIFFPNTVDHSKWAVSPSVDVGKWICIGDINRAERQTLRGGGTTCLNNVQLATIYDKIIKDIQKCSHYYLYDIELT